MAYNPGDFSFIDEPARRMMLEDAYTAVCLADAWQLLKENYTPGKFMSYSNPLLNPINKNLKYTNHTGGSYALTMRNMQYISENGWNNFVSTILSSIE